EGRPHPVISPGRRTRPATIRIKQNRRRAFHGPAALACRKATRSRGNPFLPAYAGQKFLPPGIPLGTKLSAEPRTRRKAARTLSALNFPVCVPSIRTCRLDGTFLTVCFLLQGSRCFPAPCAAGPGQNKGMQILRLYFRLRIYLPFSFKA